MPKEKVVKKKVYAENVEVKKLKDGNFRLIVKGLRKKNDGGNK
ncbi:MAG: hypothetical protein ABIF08_01455 [Nanoarchaeota archaeon]